MTIGCSRLVLKIFLRNVTALAVFARSAEVGCFRKARADASLQHQDISYETHDRVQEVTNNLHSFHVAHGTAC